MKPKDGANILILSPDKILLFHRDNIPTIRSPDCWSLIGGGIEDGETPEQALVREVKEETSYDIKEYKFVTKIRGSLNENVWVYVAFIGKDEEKEFVLGPGEGQGIGWFTINKALAINLTPGTRMMLSKYQGLVENMMATKSVPNDTLSISYTNRRQ